METFTLQDTKEKSSVLIWSRVSVATRSKHKQTINGDSANLLNNVSGMVRSGEIIAVIGASGVGKTTLMNVLSGRHGNDFQTTGEVYLNGSLTTRLERILSGLIGHIEQQELFIETMSTQEHLIFQAMLRMPHTVTDAERRLRVINTVQQLQLTVCANTIIRQLSGGERKRLAFATALLTNPHILLVDEPTSGLDAYLAMSIMRMIRSMAVEQGKTIIVVMHQPTNAMLDLVDKICLLVQGGRQAFFGTKDEALDFFVNECHLSSSSLDGFIEQLAAPLDSTNDQDGVIAQKVAADEYAKSRQATLLESTIASHLESPNKINVQNTLDDVGRVAFRRQLKWLLWRSLVSGKRNPRRTTMLIVRLTVMALIFGVFFYHLRPNTKDYIQNMNALSFLLFLSLFESNMSLVLIEIPSERILLIWECRRRLYSVEAYYINRLIIDICQNIITSTIYIIIIVVLTGMHRWAMLIFVTILNVINACSFAALIAALASTSREALLIRQPVQQIFTNFTGYFVNLSSIPFYMRWMQYLSYFYYAYNLTLMLEWHNIHLSLPCTQTSVKESSIHSTSLLRHTCPVMGDDILRCFHISYQNFESNIMALIIMIVVCHFGAFVIIFSRIRRSL